MKRLSTVFSALLLSLFVHSAMASQWQLDPNNSQLNFISTKKISVSEIHQFTQLSGSVDEMGNATIDIDLASVDTKIDIRNERMRKYLFNTDMFPKAQLTAQIEPATLDAIAEGASTTLTIDATLNLHGQSVPLVIDVAVTRLVGAKLSVVSLQPVLLNVADFNLVAGVDKLTELAGLPSISYTVPVTFYLTFSLN